MFGQQWEARKEQGFTLVELLVAVVVVGVLAAVAIVGINGLVDKGENSACSVTMDSATHASAAFYAITGAYPQQYDDMTNPPAGGALLHPAPAVVKTPTTLQGKGWTLTLQPGATPAQRTTFSGC